MKEKKTTLQA